MEEQDTYLQSRADTMRTIESTIVELGQMFTQLATMVKEQEELVHRIDANVDEAEMNVEAAHHEILKYFKAISSNRMLMIKVFGIMIVFFVIFVVFMA
ncbi:Syntaxin-5 [Portunus trituberculatus]|uniref:Syntaxin-5 n=2 Tax=Portunus trituberculatus TaxID=210409 RepID=A0A5B7E398_PORTR|nr:Syntaxin-5 [Portunus trituberculatus]